jgi:hypothetical protein
VEFNVLSAGTYTLSFDALDGMTPVTPVIIGK